MSRMGKITLWTLCETNTAITYGLEEVHSSTGSSSSTFRQRGRRTREMFALPIPRRLRKLASFVVIAIPTYIK